MPFGLGYGTDLNLSSNLTGVLSNIIKYQKCAQLPVKGPQLKHIFYRWLASGTIAVRLNEQEVKMSDVIAKVISQKGTCAAEHKIGDEFAVGEQVPPDFCLWAFYSLFPFVQVLAFGGSFPWEKDKDRAIVACPDAAKPGCV